MVYVHIRFPQIPEKQVKKLQRISWKPTTNLRFWYLSNLSKTTTQGPTFVCFGRSATGTDATVPREGGLAVAVAVAVGWVGSHVFG